MHSAVDSQILEGIRRAFAGRSRPDHFTNHLHWEECAGHDEVLCLRDLDTLSIADAANPGWDPICFISQEGFRYYFPALARLTLAEPDEQCGWCGSQLFFHLLYD